MVFDMNQSSVAGDLLVYPDFAFAANPKQPSQIEETVTIHGNTGGNVISIGGSVDATSTGPFLLGG